MTTLTNGNVEAIDTIVQAARTALEPPALSVAVAVGGDVIFAKGYGMRNVGESLPADADTVYNIASVSKQFAAAALMRLRERGLVSLEERPSTYLAWAKYPDQITLRHFLTHTSGIRDFCSLPEFDWLPFTEATPEQIARRSGIDLAFAPGEDWQYCNTTYVMLGALIERIAGCPYHEYIRREFFEPLEMTRTNGDELTRILPNSARGYSRFSLGPWERARDWHPDWEFTTGSVQSTVLDLTRWNAALRSGRVVRPEDYAEMTVPALLKDGTDTKYGLGLGVADVEGIKEVRHSGGLPGFSTLNATYPEIGIDIVVFANADGVDSYYSIVRPILARLTGKKEIAGAQQPVESKIQPLDERQVLIWAQAALDGTLGDREPNEALRDFLTARRVAALRNLSRFGAVRGVQLFERYQRGARLSYGYRVELEHRLLDMMLTLRDGTTLEEIGFGVWYPET